MTGWIKTIVAPRVFIGKLEPEPGYWQMEIQRLHSVVSGLEVLVQLQARPGEYVKVAFTRDNVREIIDGLLDILTRLDDEDRRVADAATASGKNPQGS